MMTWRILLSLLVFLFASTLFAAGPLTLTLIEPETRDDAGRMDWRLVVTNSSASAVDNVGLYFWAASYGHKLDAFPENCSRTHDEQVLCKESFPAGTTREIHFVTKSILPFAHFMSGVEMFTAQQHLVRFESSVFGRPYLVTNVDDDGPGSLRQAIEDINRECTIGTNITCAVTFNIPGPAPSAGWFTIQLKSALAEITAADVVFDGHSQTRFLGDTNLKGPEIVIDGSDVENGSGLVFRTSGEVRDLAIGGFPQNGIESSGYSIALKRAWLGVDGSGLRALPNGGRGIQIFGGSVLIDDSILSGNAHAGAFIWTANRVQVYDNLVGVGADGTTAIGNGASGLFFHNPALRWDYAEVRDNVIANNRQAGIALTPFAAGNFAANVMYGNANGAIDINLDGATRETRLGLPGKGGIMGPPSIESARYENGVTTITVRPNSKRAGSTAAGGAIYVYANTTGKAEAEEILGTLDRGPNGSLTLTVNRDLHGKFITASEYTVWIYNWDDPAPGTSELSEAVEVR